MWFVLLLRMLLGPDNMFPAFFEPLKTHRKGWHRWLRHIPSCVGGGYDEGSLTAVDGICQMRNEL